MAVRLEELKKQRIQERDAEVQRRLEKRFRSANDDLRLDETRFQNRRRPPQVSDSDHARGACREGS